MTTVITRYFESAEQARLVKKELVYRRRFSIRILKMYETADGLADALVGANVDPAAAQAYQDRMASGGAVMLVNAGYKPLGVAKITREVTAQMGAVELDGVTEEATFKEPLNTQTSVLSDHPRFLTRDRDPDSTNYHMANFPIPLISRRQPMDQTVIPRHGRMASWPVPLLNDRKPFTGSIFGRHARMANFPLPLISKRKPFTGSIIGRHARMANFPLPLISRRKPKNRTIIGRHTRMANWPFPHLINGEQGTNALMPGGPRMANFPIGLLSNRKPFTGSILPRHGRMANFPIPLISKRKPFTGSIFPRHARMADMFLPLIFSDRKDAPEPKGFFASKMMGIPTLLRR